jgi:hypothetical protein
MGLAKYLIEYLRCLQMWLQNVHPFCLPSADYLMGELYALSPFKPILIAKSVHGVGDFGWPSGQILPIAKLK